MKRNKRFCTTYWSLGDGTRGTFTGPGLSPDAGRFARRAPGPRAPPSSASAGRCARTLGPGRGSRALATPGRELFNARPRCGNPTKGAGSGGSLLRPWASVPCTQARAGCGWAAGRRLWGPALPPSACGQLLHRPLWAPWEGPVSGSQTEPRALHRPPSWLFPLTPGWPPAPSLLPPKPPWVARFRGGKKGANKQELVSPTLLTVNNSLLSEIQI